MVKYTNYDYFTENDVVDVRGLSEEKLQRILALNPTNDCEFEWIRKSEYYRPKGDGGTGKYGNIEYARLNGFTIHPASDFLDEEWTPKWGEEIEISDDGKDWSKALFVGMNPDPLSPCKFVCSPYRAIYARPLTNPRIAEIKAEIAKLQEELKSLEQ